MLEHRLYVLRKGRQEMSVHGTYAMAHDFSSLAETDEVNRNGSGQTWGAYLIAPKSSQVDEAGTATGRPA